MSPGSHRWGTLFKPSDFITRTGTFPKIGGIDYDDLADLPPIDAEPDNYDVRRYEAGPGDVIVHHWMTLHGSTGNVSTGSLRRAASVRYAGDGVTFSKRRSSPEPFRNTVGLEDGDPLEDAERFKVVWSVGEPARSRARRTMVAVADSCEWRVLTSATSPSTGRARSTPWTPGDPRPTP